MTYRWKVFTCPISDLEMRLNQADSHGWGIFQILWDAARTRVSIIAYKCHTHQEETDAPA